MGKSKREPHAVRALIKKHLPIVKVVKADNSCPPGCTLACHLPNDKQGR